MGGEVVAQVGDSGRFIMMSERSDQVHTRETVPRCWADSARSCQCMSTALAWGVKWRRVGEACDSREDFPAHAK
jgi:hypothetical protein